MTSIIAKPFEVTNFKVDASSRSQLNQPVTFTYRDEFGNFRGSTVVPSAQRSMWQRQPNEVDTLNQKMYFSSESSVDFLLLPDQEVTIIMSIGKQFDPSKELQKAA